MERLKRRALAELIFLLMVTVGIHADEDVQPYLSPGIQIGYGFGDGFFMGSQLTLGWVTIEDAWTVSPFNPGITLGVRKSFGGNKIQISYADIQISAVVAGLGIGIATTRSKATNERIFGKRVKLWAGGLGLLTYDYSQIPGVQQTHHFGLMGVLPIAEGGF
jgi:hypothetical protein